MLYGQCTIGIETTGSMQSVLPVVNIGMDRKAWHPLFCTDMG